MTEKQVLQSFYDLQTCSPRRIIKIKGVMNNARKFTGKDLSKLTLKDITHFLRELNNSPFTEWTKNDYKKIFKSFLKHTYKEKFLTWMDNRPVQDGFRCASRKRAFNNEKINKNTLIKPEELEALLRTAPSLKWKALLTLLYESAFRPCELVNLRWKDLQFIDSKNICSVTTVSPKTKDKRSVPVRDCVVHLKRWREEFEFSERKEEDFLFPNPRNREASLSEQSVGVLMKRLCKKAGVRPLFPYMFRHSRIYSIQKTLGARLAAKYAGHSIETSQIYDHLDSDDVEEAMLEKIYVTEELTPEQKHELEKEVEELKEKLSFVTKGLTKMEQTIEKFILSKQKT